ncbi:MATE family efflux transporter [Methanobrevibacter sp.]|uniref:MATE family efflux transporter n=1 Tax=Methanobrevibacter sp. TaxID=66852 RepID=UPI0038910B03
MTYERSYNLLNSKFRELFFPTLLAAIAGNFALIADGLIISALLGPMNLSVIQSIEPLAQFANVIYWMIGFGGTILATSAKANFKEKKANQIFTLSLISILIISLLVTVLGLLFPDIFLQALCNSSQLRPLVSGYYMQYLITIPIMCFFIVLAYFAKTDNFVQLQFRAFLMANILNVVFDIVLIKYTNLGVSGAALSTTLGYVVATVYLSKYIFDSKRTLKLVKIDIGESVKDLLNICKTGFSASSVALYQSVKLIIVNFLILGALTNVGLVAYNMCCNVQLLVSIFIFGTAQSILPIVTVYFQEKDYNGVEYVARNSLKITVLFGIVFMLLFTIFPQSILFVFSVKNPSDIPVVMNAVRIFSLCILAYSINFLYIFYLQSIQNNKIANIVTLLNGLILPVAFVFIFSTARNENGIWFAFVLTEVVTLIFIYLYSRYINKKTDGEYSGLFLKKQNDANEKMMEYTIEGNENEGVYLSRQIQEFLPKSKSYTFVSLAVEEITVYIMDINDKLDWIDIIIRDNDESTIISIKYSGKGYNPEEDPNLDSDNIRMLRSISDNIDYSQILGLNNTVITINK